MSPVVGELHGLPIRQKLDVNFPQADEGLVATDEGKHPPILRKSRVHRGVGEEGELLPLFADYRSAVETSDITDRLPRRLKEERGRKVVDGTPERFRGYFLGRRSRLNFYAFCLVGS